MVVTVLQILKLGTSAISDDVLQLMRTMGQATVEVRTLHLSTITNRGAHRAVLSSNRHSFSSFNNTMLCARLND